MFNESDFKIMQWVKWLRHVYNDEIGIRNFMCDDESRKILLENLYAVLSAREASKKENESLQRSLEEMQTENDSLKKSLDESNATLRTLQATLGTIKVENNTLTQENKMLRDSLEESKTSSGSMKLFDDTLKQENAYWKNKVVKNYTPYKIRKKLMENGKIIYKQKSIDEKRDYVQLQLDTLWEENKRLNNAQTFILNLSPALQELKTRLLNTYSTKKVVNNIEEIDMSNDIDFETNSNKTSY